MSDSTRRDDAAANPAPDAQRREDERWMRRALALAAKGDTSPNPRVGCVIVHDGRLLSSGYHHRVGQAHAEVEALTPLNFSAPGATLYVTLEPCAHHGRTPPCTETILRSGIRRVVAAMVDPNPLVQGRGLELLRQAGLEVVVGVLEAKAQALNRGFIKAMLRRLPHVTLKLAATADGKTATRTGASRWITGPDARALVHRWRGESDGVLVGIGTVLKDDPQLTVRLSRPLPNARERRPPVRVVLDSQLRCPLNARILEPDAPTLLVCGEHVPVERQQLFRARGIEVLTVPCQATAAGERLDLVAAMTALLQRGLVYLFAEPGATLGAALLQAGLVDRCLFFYAPQLFGGVSAPGMLGGEGVAEVAESIRLQFERFRRVGADLLVEAVPLPTEGRTLEESRGRR